MAQFTNYPDNIAFCQADEAGKGNKTTANPAQQSSGRTMDPFDTGDFFVGEIIRAGAGLYDVQVRGGNVIKGVCNILSDLSSPYLGYSDAFIPVEGSRVLIYMPYAGSQFGLILGAIPAADTGRATPKGAKPSEAACQLIDNEGGASYATEAAFRTPWADKEFTSMVNANAGRPLDIFPGNRVWTNEQGIGISLLNLMISLRATERAKIELGVLDDTIRIVSGYMRHISAQGEEQIYNDGGFITRICTGTSWQSEKSGFSKIDTKLTTEDSDKVYLNKSEKSKYALLKDDLDSKKRFQWMAGHLGDMLNYFIANPDPSVDIETRSNDSKDQGLLHTHVDTSGRVAVRSAGGISFQRWDRIPVPKRKFEAWDPSGDKLEQEDPITEKKPFDLPADHPYARSLVLRDLTAWNNKLSYQRIHEIAQSAAEAHTDFYLPEEKDMETPKDNYDVQGKATEHFKEYDLRNSFLNIEPDGSIIIRDAWGSEIIMRGGNIILNAAGQLEFRSGGSIVQMAGHDVITKAKKSIDITATDNDVRIKANANLHLLSEGREGSAGGGGILLESKSKNEGFDFEDVAKGERAYSTGIVLKAADSRIFARGKNIQLSSPKHIMMDTFDTDGTNTGRITMSSKDIYATASNMVYVTASEGSGLILQSNIAILAGNIIEVVAKNSVTLYYSTFKAGYSDVPLIPGPHVPPYEEIGQSIKDTHDILQSVDWVGLYNPEKVETIEFTYRSSQEYGTLSPSEIQGASRFVVYQAAWAQMANAKSSMVPVVVEAWSEYPISDTYAWPGASHYNGKTAYIKYDTEVNIEDPKKGIPKIRKELVDKPGEFSAVAFDEYEVVKH